MFYCAVEALINRLPIYLKYLAMALFVSLPFVGGWIGYQAATTTATKTDAVVPTLADQADRIAQLQANPELEINNLDDWQMVMPFAERQAIYAAARTYIADNSVADMQCSLVFDWKRGDWIRFTVIPETVETDNGLLFMRNVAGKWQVENFGTAFPEMYEAFPQLFDE